MSGDVHVRFCERPAVRCPRGTHRNVYVRSRQTGERALCSLARFLTERLKVRGNHEKSAAAKPQQRSFLRFSFTFGEQPRIKLSAKADCTGKRKFPHSHRLIRGELTQSTEHFPKTTSE